MAIPTKKELAKLEKELKQLEKKSDKELDKSPHKLLLTGLNFLFETNWGHIFTDEQGRLFRLCWSTTKQKPILKAIEGVF